MQSSWNGAAACCALPWSLVALWSCCYRHWPCTRNRAFYAMTTLFGAAFGVSFSLFQDLTWQMLPLKIKLANAMGFNVMSRLLGIGLGNFICGLILDMSYSGKTNAFGDDIYAFGGYVALCCISGLLLLGSTLVANHAIQAAMRLLEQVPDTTHTA